MGKYIIGIIIIVIIAGLASGGFKDEPKVCDDRKCSSCGTFIGCYGYDCKSGLDIGPSPMYHECAMCARAYCY